MSSLAQASRALAKRTQRESLDGLLSQLSVKTLIQTHFNTFKKMSANQDGVHTSEVARNIAKQVANPSILAFCDKLNDRLEACHVHVDLKTNFLLPGREQSSYLVFLLEKDKEVVSHITCHEYLRKGVYWVAINSFTSEPHRRRYYNLLLRAVALAVLTMVYHGMAMKIYSSIANDASSKALKKYFNIHEYTLCGGGVHRKVSSLLLDGVYFV